VTLLTGLKVVQIGPGLACAVCTRLLTELGAQVTCIDPASASILSDYLDYEKTLAADGAAPHDALKRAELIVMQGTPRSLTASTFTPAALHRLNPGAVIAMISPYGQTGPRAEDPATDLTLFFASGIARMLTGQVDDLSEAPIRPVGEQSAFVSGIAAACASMHAVLGEERGATIDVSIQETLATLAITELARAGLTGRNWSRKRLTDGNGATVTILPARDGYTAISPREEKQWAAWLTAMGSPPWGDDPRFTPKSNRVKHWDALHTLMSDWSRQYAKQWIADTAQREHVPSFPLREVAEHLDTPQMQHRGYYRERAIGRRTVKVPGSPFGIGVTQSNKQSNARAGAMPLAGVRVLDFSWVIAGPTTTRYLAAMGAEVIKVEAPGKGDPGRSSELHTVLGQAKKAIVLDLKKPAAVAIARELAEKSDILIENYATGVMDRLGLGADTLKALNPNLIYISASGMGRSGPDAHAVAYGTLLQCYAGFAGLNRHPHVPPRIGLAWLDPMCGLMLAFIAAAALWHRQRTGGVARVDFSMLEAMLWTMAEPLMATQIAAPPNPMGNASTRYAPHGVWRCAGDDDWISVVARSDTEWHALCEIVPGLTTRRSHDLAQRLRDERAIGDAIAAWAAPLTASAAQTLLVNAGVAAAAAARSSDLVKSEHLAARGFWDSHGDGVLPGLPWRASFGRTTGPAPGLGADTDAVLTEVLGLSCERIAALRADGALG
jgi:crotonobetainyl-CoA:carnitine CoA-transferase CaiB-like acyl-CoA transferase